MPKMKTNRGAAKRFKVTGSGKVKHGRAGRRHILSTKAPKRKRQLRAGAIASKPDEKALRRLMPYAF
jgi:large subunit ribosomal protein L35